MTTTWMRPVQLSLGAVALCMASWAGAQTAAPAEGAAPPPPPAAAAPAKPKHHMKKHHMKKHHMEKHHRHHKDAAKRGHDGQDPAQREAAAAREQARRGGLESKSGDQYERNALARCDVFKNEPDRNACVERVRQPGEGSVKDGGILREYTQQVPVSR